ncbi:MAG TPA: LEA type 2 family protein [Methanospirillum sp.]|jgi:LEA14-like dessication related protein|uniref:LEA type 2 family protein n=1 Tax=Methanospirillum sp. TaxID=45200 RepID=UPI0009D3E651|nr:LEA type 2 family protein [Methanospirillum sp.]OQB35708.1 MAG: Late embryogenesis abundant protein [Euryarchaeota archaeon ADurb.Bin165]HPY60737.1 LEA type 2 family protein [Methanospirillum sp.]
MKLFYAILLPGVLIALTFLCGCSAIFKEPTVIVESIDLAYINATDLGLDITLKIHNPNFFGVMFQKITADVSYLKGKDWNPLSHVETKDIDITIGESTIILPVTAKNADLIRAGFQILASGEVTVQVEGIAEPSFFGFVPKIPFRQTRTIPLKS